MQLERIEVIYEKYYLRVMKAAYGILHDYHLSQDICQEVFIQLVRVHDHIDEDMIGSWLMVNARRRAIDMYRKVTPEQQNSTLENHMEIYDRENVEKRVEIKDFEERLFRKLEKHNPDWYTIVMRLVINNEKPEDVARDLGINLPYLRTKLHRARTWIRENFEEYYREL